MDRAGFKGGDPTPGAEVGARSRPGLILFRWALTEAERTILEAGGWQEVHRHPVHGSSLMRKDEEPGVAGVGGPGPRPLARELDSLSVGESSRCTCPNHTLGDLHLPRLGVRVREGRRPT
jgi:hypothetical protein